MYFDWKTYHAVFRRAFHEPSNRRRRRLVWTLAILAPLVAAFDALCFALDHVFFPGFRKVEIRSPIFIVGHARSGTTKIHRLLSGDPRFAYFRTWEILLPSILQKKIVRGIAILDARLLGGRIASRLEARQDRALGKARRMHDWRLDGAEEDGFLGLHAFSSGTLSVIFPYNAMLEHLSDLDRKADARGRRRALRFYAGCLKRQIYFEGGEKILLSKNPAFTTRMRSLLEVFPDLRFVCTVRHPYETIPSLINLLQKGWQAMGADPRDIAEAAAWMGESSLHTYRYAFEVIDGLPADQSFIASFGELVSRPKQTIERLYAHFGWEITPEYAAFLEAEQGRARDYESAHRYEAGLGPSRERIQEELAPLFERFGWSRD
jgi:hypothetical protein